MSAYPEGMVWKPAKEEEMKKHEVLIGRRFRVRPVPTVGKDGKTYPVLTLLAGGRGWFARQYVVPSDANAEIVVEVCSVGSQGQFRFADVRIISGENTALTGTFVKNPYKRKDGTVNSSFRPHNGWFENLRKAYGVDKERDAERYKAFKQKWEGSHYMYGDSPEAQARNTEWLKDYNATETGAYTTLIEIKFLTDEVR